MLNIYDINGEPIDIITWSKKSLEYRIIGKTKVGEQEVSTVWLGLNHNYSVGKPLIFETMVFPKCDIYERYETLEQAKDGHLKIVKQLESEQEPISNNGEVIEV